MKKTLALMAIVLSVGMTAALDAEAKRLGGARNSGMQRQQVTAPQNAPGNPAQGAPGQTAPVAGAAAASTGAAAAATAKRSWMGPVAGLAAGLGIAALASHFGFGEALANMLTIALVAMLALALIGFLLRKRAASQAGAASRNGAAYAGAGGPFQQPQSREALQPQQPAGGMFRTGSTGGGSLIGSRLGGGMAAPAAAAGVGSIPAGFDVAGFERNAQAQFTALQAANDAGDLQRLREYLSPEMYEVVRDEVAARDGAVQQTEVFGLRAQLLDVSEEADRYVASVRFTGSIREQHGVAPEDLDETWHLVKPRSGAGGWTIAGIQQNGAEPTGWH